MSSRAARGVSGRLEEQATVEQAKTIRPVELDLEITRNQLNLMLLEAHKKSANSTEEVAAIRELGKINGLYEPEAPDITINITQDIRKLEVMSDVDLLRLAGKDASLLDTSVEETEEEEEEEEYDYDEEEEVVEEGEWNEEEGEDDE